MEEELNSNLLNNITEEDPITGQSLNRITNYNDSDPVVASSNIDLRDMFYGGSDSSDTGILGSVQLYDYDASKYDRNILPGELGDLEGIRESNQGILDSMGRSIANLVGKTGINVAGGLIGTAYGIGSAIANGDSTKIFDNSVVQSLDKASESVGDYFKVYKSDNFEDMNLISKAVLHPIQFTDTVMDALSFTTGAILTELISGGVASAFIVPKALKYLKGLDRASDAIDVANNITSKATNFMQGLGNAGSLTRQLATGAAWEASVEARQATMELRSKMESDWMMDNPGLSLDDMPDEIRNYIDDRLSSAGMFTFLTNIPLVGGSQMLQFPKVFGAGYNTSRRAVDASRIARDETTGLFEDTASRMTANQRRIDNVKTAIKNPFYEGIVEEGGQSVLSNTAGMYWDRKNDIESKDNINRFIESFGKSLIDTYTTKEGWDEIGMGMIIGALGAPGRGALSILGKDSSLGSKAYRDIRNEQGDIIGQEREPLWTGGVAESFQQRAEETQRIANVVDDLNNHTDIFDSMKSHYDFLVKTGSQQKVMDIALDNEDIFAYENVKDDMLHSYITSRIEAGLSDDLDTTASQLREIPTDDFYISFKGEEASKNVSEREKLDFKNRSIQSFERRVDNIREATNTIDSIYRGDNSDLREELIYNIASAKNIDIRENSINEGLSKLTGGFINNTSLRSMDALTIDDNIVQLTEDLEEEGILDEDKAVISEDIKRLKNAKKSIFKNLSAQEINLVNEFIKERPVEASTNMEQVVSMIEDSKKVRQRRQSLLGIYNYLFTEEGQARFAEYQDKINKATQKEQENIESEVENEEAESKVKERQKEILEKHIKNKEASQEKSEEVASEDDVIVNELDEGEAIDYSNQNIDSIEEARLQEFIAASESETGLTPEIEAEINRKYDAMLEALNIPSETEVNKDNLTPEEEVVGNIQEQDALFEEIKDVNNDDGLVLNDLESDKKESMYNDLFRKRDVGNTITSLNIDYSGTETYDIDTDTITRNIEDVYDESGNLRIVENFDSRLQDPSQFNEGSRVDITIPTYEQIQSRGIQGEYTEDQYNTDMESLETMPIAFIDENNKILGFLPTTENVKKNVREELRPSEIISNKTFRGKIFNNRDQVFKTIITKKSTGAPMFSRNRQSIYNALGDGNSLSEGVKVAIFKNGQLRSGLNTIVSEKVKLPDGVSSSEYFKEGVIYTVIPTANGVDYFSFASDVSNISDNDSSSIVRMLQLFRANPNTSSDRALIQERNKLAREVDFSNFPQLMNSINSIIYTNNKDDRYMFDVNLNTGVLSLGISSDMKFNLDDIKNNKSDTIESVKNILSNRYYSVKLENFGSRYRSFSIDDNNNLVQDSYKNYNDYLNDKSIITTKIQGEPIEGTNKKYFTAQSVIEVSRPIQSGFTASSIEEATIADAEELFAAPSQSIDKKEIKKKDNPRNKLGTRIKPRRPPSISEDFSDLLIDDSKSLDQQVEDLMNKCK